MDELAVKDVEIDRGAEGPEVELGQWMGRREAFGLIAGRCSAADIEIIRRIKEEKLYARMNCTWSEFCANHLHVARRTVDKEIAYLHAYGPAFFTIRQLTHVHIKDYRAIAPHVTEQGVCVDDKVVPLLPENSKPLAQAVEELLRRSTGKTGAVATGSFDALLQKCQATVRALRAFQEPLDAAQKKALRKEAVAIVDAASDLGAKFLEIMLEA